MGGRVSVYVIIRRILAIVRASRPAGLPRLSRYLVSLVSQIHDHPFRWLRGRIARDRGMPAGVARVQRVLPIVHLSTPLRQRPSAAR